jgi:cellobiose-specific phosphotransferase system component IIB
MYNYILVCNTGNMVTSFVSKLAKSGTDSNGKGRRIIIIPSDRVKEVTKKFEGKQVKITIEEI